jgi:L-arabinonolactonase
MSMPHSLDVGNLLGEGVLWDVRTQTALWTDIESARFWRWHPGGIPISFALPQRLGSFGLTATAGTYIGAFEQGFARFSPEAGTLEMLAPVTAHDPHLRMNDGRVDRNGVFWAGSMAEQDNAGSGALWRYDGGAHASRMLGNVSIPNSLCWSLDGRIMYFADSPRNTIWRYRIGGRSEPLGNPEIFATTPPGVHPDGSCIDSEDHLWNAQWGSGEVVRYRPDGSVERRLALPVSQPSCVAFGGPQLDHLLMTTARVDLTPQQLQAEPLAGSLLIRAVGVTGVAEPICDVR